MENKMKKYFYLILAITLWILDQGCSKESVPQNKKIINYAGVYDAANGDTAFVSGNGIFTKIEWSPIHNPHRFVFDSIVVNPDFSFTDNEICDYGKGTLFYKSIGAGNFGTNTMSLHFNLDGGDIYFNGIKKK